MSLGSVEDDVISAMLESGHGGSLAGVMAPMTSPDIFASFSSPAAGFHNQGGGLARASSMSQPGLSQARQQQPSRAERWAPGSGDEKWMLDAKGEVLAMHTASSFGAEFDSFMPAMVSSGGNGVGGGGLHRYHSAPSSFLQALTEDAFSQIPAIGSSAMFADSGLTPITEQMDMERSGSASGEFEHFLAPDSDFTRRAALSALGKPDTTEPLASLGKSTGQVRQKTAPASQQSAPRQDAGEEHHSEESLSGTSEDNSLVSGLKVSTYEDMFSRDAPTSWPTSPGTPGGGKRPRGLPLESDPSSGSAENAKPFRLAGIPQNGLIRHASLPTPAAAAPPGLADDHYVQMRARAKRGCATHPRSIAERVRRTRISERMKKLQDLVPNMEKTTNTSDMLDETVEYVKSLQMQVSELNATIAKLRAAMQSTAGP